MSTSGSTITGDVMSVPQIITDFGGLSLEVDSLPKLKGHSNYQHWFGAWRLLFRAAGWWGVVSGVKTKPEDEESIEYKTWDDIDAKAHFSILTGTSEDIQLTVSSASSAAEAWKVLKELYDCSTFRLLRIVKETRLQEGGSIPDHLQLFQNNWAMLTQRCRDQTDGLNRGLYPLTLCSEAKAVFLLSSLPPSMGNFVESIRDEGDAVTYEDVRKRLFNLSRYRSVDSVDGKECTWCKKRNLLSKGHEYTECNKLKAAQKQRRGGDDSDTTSP